MTIELEDEQRKELEIQSSIYTNEMTIIKSSSPMKFKINVSCLLESQNYNFHYEFVDPDVIMTFELNSTYPLDTPYFYLESNSSEVCAKGGLVELEDELKGLMRALRGTMMIYDVVEQARSILYNRYAKRNKHFNKRKHIFQQDDDVLFIEDAPEAVQIENLVAKDSYTLCSPETFLVWKLQFMKELRDKQAREPAFKERQQKLAKPSGRAIFEKQKTLNLFYEDGKGDDDDQDVDIAKLKNQAKDEDVEIDEEAFDDDEDLDDLELDEEEMDEEKEMEALFL